MQKSLSNREKPYLCRQIFLIRKMYMKGKGYLLLALLGMVTACEHKPSFTVVGNITDAADKVLYFEHSGLSGIETLDSVKLDASGSYSFSGNRPESPEYYRLRVDDKVINFSVDSTETIGIHADFATFATGYKVEGSENNDKIKELVLLQADLQKRVNELSAASMPIGILQDSLQQTIARYKDQVKRNYIFAAPNKPYAYFALLQEVNGAMIFDPLTDRNDVKCFAAVATSLNNAYPHADRSRNLYNTVIKGMKNTRVVKEKELEVNSDVVKEASLIDIQLRDVNGNVRTLSELKGKVVLLNFTTYQDKMSGTYNLALRELYNKYSAKGLEIYQISLDGDEHFWKVASDNLPWICVRDAKGGYSTYANLYSVTQLPTIFLINRSNELSLRATPQTDLEAAINKLL